MRNGRTFSVVTSSVVSREVYLSKGGTGETGALTNPNRRQPDWTSSITFLIHGYNNDAEDAATNFQSLFHEIENIHLRLPTQLESQSWLVYWPAYASGGLASGKLRFSFLSYPWQIESAKVAAEALKRYIDYYRTPTTKVNIIAHSLGCRLVLEMLDKYAQEPAAERPVFSVVILMAAAVPTYFFTERYRLWKGAHLPEKCKVLFSSNDWVLKIWFPVGQTVALEGVSPTAVGANGMPIGFWNEAVPTRNGHGGYFQDRQTAYVVAKLMGRPVSTGLAGAKLATAGLPSRYLTGDPRSNG